MGKDSKHQRTKGGVQPSNASRAAKLLEKQQQQVPIVGVNSFLAASAEARNEYLQSSLLDSPVHSKLLIDDELPPEVRLVFRKLLKKDGTTKIKALFELTHLIEQPEQQQPPPSSTPPPQPASSSTTSVQITPQELSTTVLPQWTKLYPKLTQDESRKVRELAQSTHTIVCKAVGRSLAKHLKQLMPYWFMSQFDLYSPVASAAKKSFHTVFPTECKRVDALKFCCAEIHAHLKSNFETVWCSRKGADHNNDDDEANVRVVVGTIFCVAELVKIGIVEEGFLAHVFGEQGLFWKGVHSWDQVPLVKRPSIDLLSTVLRSTTSSSVLIPLSNCTKLLNSPQPDTFVHVINLLQVLCETGKMSAPQARSKLLTYANSSFYHQASQTQSVGPILEYILRHEDNSSELVQKFIAAMSVGIAAEKSQNERISMVRVVVGVADILAQDELLIGFLVDNLSSCTGELPKTLGRIRGVEFFQSFCSCATERACIDTEAFGNFFINMATGFGGGGGCGGVGQQRRVMFQEEREEKPASNVVVQIDGKVLEIVRNVVKYCVDNRAWVPVAMLSRKLGAGVWENVHAGDVDLDGIAESDLRLTLVLDLIAVWENDPRLLATLSNMLDEQESAGSSSMSSMTKFLKELTPFLHIKSISRWVNMDVFMGRLTNLISNDPMTEQQVSSVLNFIEQLSSGELVKVVAGRLDDSDEFAHNLARCLKGKEHLALFSPLYEKYWDKYLGSVVHQQDDDADHLVQELCHDAAASSSAVALVVRAKLDHYLSECKSVRELNRMVEVINSSSSVVCGGDDEKYDFITIPPTNISHGLLSFLFLSYDVGNGLNGGLTEINPFNESHRVIVVKSLAFGKLVLQRMDEDLLVPALLKVLHAQALCEVVERLSSVTGGWDIPTEFATECKQVSSRLVECVHENNEEWKKLGGIVLQQQRGDRIWESRLPLRILMNYCDKSELKLSLNLDEINYDGGGVELVDQVLEQIACGCLEVGACIDWICKLRQDHAEIFGFDVLFRNIPDLTITCKLALITLELLNCAQDQGALSTLSCWVASWVNGVKYVDPSRAWCYWTSLLGCSVQAIGRRGRNIDLFNFVGEYVGFLAAQVYPGMYRIALELGDSSSELLRSGCWWRDYTLSRVCGALAYVPSGCLFAIEPSSMEICEKFSPMVVEGGTLPVRIAAYRVLRKAAYENKDLPIVPPVIDHLIRSLVDKLEFEQPLISYLLLWDALLRIQEKSNEFASYVRDQPHLLSLLLNTLFFSTTINIESASQRHFDIPGKVYPFFPVNLLHLACSVLHRALRNLPYTVRWWWNNHIGKQRDRVFVEKFVVKHLSSRLADEELRNAQVDGGGGGGGEDGSNKDSNVTVHCHSGCNELVAHYRIEETNVTLTISLPLNHPLGPVTVKISDKKLHAKISHLLNTRSHSLSAGLRLWKETLDSLYKDVDECAICFFILHHVTKQTPKLACKTCRKKFHAACLYKWFSTSNKSECPLCRNLF